MPRLSLTIFALLLSPVLWAGPETEIANQIQPPLRTIYEARQFAPLWLEQGRPSARAHQAVDAILHAADDALDTDDYDPATLQKMMADLEQQAGSDQQQASFDLALSHSLAHFIKDLAVGRVKPDSLGFAIDTAPRRAKLPELLQQALAGSDIPAAVAAARPAFPVYASLRQLLTRYRTLAAQHPKTPTLPALPDKKLSPGEAWTGSAALAEWLSVLGYLPAGTTVDPSRYDGALVDAMKDFQQHHGQIPDGVIGKQTYQNLQVSLPQRVQQIELAMERLRWLDDSVLQKRFVIINVPQFTLWAFAPDADGGIAKPALQMAVVVGQAGKTETPLMTKSLSSLVFSPYWNVPRSIAIKEILPKLHANPDYLFQEDMELVDGDGNAHGSEVGEEELYGIAHGIYRIRQLPGQKNALGKLKFVFPNDDSIYMHDTPSKSFFAKERRDLSHGCVRLQNPMALALFALQPQGEWDENRVNEKIADSTDQHMPLRERMPVLLLYLTANVDNNGNAVFLQDIYRQDSALSSALHRPHPNSL